MSIDGDILRLLAIGGPVFPEDIQRKLGIEQALLQKHVSALAALGYEISHTPHVGYRLISIPDRLHADAIHAFLPPDSLVGSDIHVFQETNSTSDIVERLARDGAREGTVVFAEAQTKGRGRLGRKWFSPNREGLLCSILLRPQLHPTQAVQFTIAGAVAVARAVHAETGLQPQIKWPNDVLLAGKKFSGILTELHAELDRISYLVIGIGVDVNTLAFPPELQEIATSLRLESGRMITRVKLAAKILAELDACYDDIRSGGFERISDQWEQWCTTLGKSLRIDTGGSIIEGVAEALDADGSLLVRSAHGRLERAIGGDVRIIKN